MKHGDKAKSKTASKASNKKGGKTGASSKSAKITHSKKQAVAAKVAPKSLQKSSPAKPSAAHGNGKDRPGPVDFTNPVVGTAFKRALKKYSNAFRRLTD